MFASLILMMMAVLYVLARSYQNDYPALEWLRAFAEAGMVGGLADWFAVTALFRHPLGLPIPHTAVIPKGKDRIGKSFAKFIHGNFLTAERICKQAEELQLIQGMAKWMTQPEKANKLARQTLHAVPVALDVMEKYSANQIIMGKLLGQLRGIQPHETLDKLLRWLLVNQRYREILAPLLAQLAAALAVNRENIDTAARKHAPMTKIPFLGKVSQALAESMSGKAAENIENSLIDASADTAAPLWDVIEEQLRVLQQHLLSNEELKTQLLSIRDQWLSDDKSAELAHRLWLQIRHSLAADLESETPQSIQQLTDVIMSLGQSIVGNAGLARNIEAVLLEGVSDILTKHGERLETMIRSTIEEWDADTLMLKLENQVGSDLQFIRINGTLIGGVVGLMLHGIGHLVWPSY